MSALEITDLRKAFDRLVVSNGIDLAMEEGERHVVIGPNGAGKTSLVHQIGGQLTPDSGDIRLHGRSLTRMKPEQRCRHGLARTFQKNSLFRNLTCLENVRLAAHSADRPRFDPFSRASAHSAVHARAEICLQQVGLEARAGHAVRNLSYGEQRQLEIAVALATSPKVLVLDEPTSGMSPAETERVRALIHSLPRSLSILMVEHDMDVVFSVADRITVLCYGAVLATGTPDAIAQNSQVRDVYLGHGKH